VSFLCMISAIKVKTTKSNKNMANIILEDMTGSIGAIAFDSVLSIFGGTPQVGDIVTIIGKIGFKEDAAPEIILSGLKRFSPEAISQKSNQEDSYHKTVNAKELIVLYSGKDYSYIRDKLLLLCELYPGQTEVKLSYAQRDETIGRIDISQNIIDFIHKLSNDINTTIC